MTAGNALCSDQEQEGFRYKHHISLGEGYPVQASRAHALLHSKRLANSHKMVQCPFKPQSLLPRPQKVEHFHEPW